MKMKNEKEPQLTTNGIILIILGVFVLVVLIFGFTFGWDKVINFFNEPEFKITKEECRNELNEILKEKYWFLVEEQYRVGCIGECNKELDYLNCQEFSEDRCNELKQQEESTQEEMWSNLIEVCKQVEVDDSEWIEEEYCIEDVGCGFFMSSRFKEDLTIDWLNKNCLVYWCDLENNCDYFRTTDDGWGKYKCGDYFVEVT